MTTNPILEAPGHPWMSATQSRAGAVHPLLPLRVASFSLSQSPVMVSSTCEAPTPKHSARFQGQEHHARLQMLLGFSSQQLCSSLRAKGPLVFKGNEDEQTEGQSRITLCCVEGASSFLQSTMLTSHSLSQGLEKGSGDMASAIPSVLVLPPCPKVCSIGN